MESNLAHPSGSMPARRATSPTSSRRSSPHGCVRQVADVEGISMDRAFEHVRAVLTTPREAVGEQEFLDVLAQLPDEYAVALRST